MYILEILDNWANLQEREERRNPKKSRFEKIYDEKEGSEKLIEQGEFSRNSTLIVDKPKLKKPV
ncbi:MAG: hypothetical protein WED07_11145 [Candidatus Freyarchaeum deiterrae]